MDQWHSYPGWRQQRWLNPGLMSQALTGLSIGVSQSRDGKPRLASSLLFMSKNTNVYTFNIGHFTIIAGEKGR
jgi:hypothetical protein